MPIAIPVSYNFTQIRQLYKLLLIFPTGLCILRRGEGCGVLEGTNLGLNDSMAVSYCHIVRSAERVRMGFVPAIRRAQRAQMESLGHQSQVFGNLGKPYAFSGLWRFAKLRNLSRLATESFPGAVRIRPIAITEKAPPRNDPQWIATICAGIRGNLAKEFASSLIKSDHRGRLAVDRLSRFHTFSGLPKQKRESLAAGQGRTEEVTLPLAVSCLMACGSSR